MAGSLKDLRSILREFKFISDSSRIPGEFQVIAIYCYSADSNYLKALTPPLDEGGKEVIYLHDILLTDGSEKLKCFLAFPLSHLVQKNLIKVGSCIQVQKAKMCYLEGEYNDSHIVEYVLLEAVRVVDYSPVTFPVLDIVRKRQEAISYIDGVINFCSLYGKLSQIIAKMSSLYTKLLPFVQKFVESSNQRESEMIPLITGRKCYVNPWIPTVPSGEEWADSSSLEYEQSDLGQNVCLLQDLADDWMRLPRPYPPLFIRVMARGILYYYGYNKNNASHPFMASLLIADSSSACSCAGFGKVLVPFYYSAKPGVILLIQNYKISKPHNYEHIPRLRGSAGNLPVIDLQIIFSEYTKIQVVPPTDDLLRMQIASLPPVEFSFGNRASLDLAAEDSTIDVVGLVTHVSLLHRFIYKFGKLHARCYVEMIDSSSFLPFIAIFYDNGARYNIQELHPGQVLVATHMKVCQLPDDLIANSQIRIYLKATHFTEAFSSHRQESLYVRYPAVTAVASIIRDNPGEITFLQNNMLRMGGIQTYIRGYKSLESYKESFGNSVAGKMIPGAYWKTALESLVFRERRFVTLGGFIVQIDYVDLDTVHSSQPVYGWSYASSINSRRTLFLNIKAMHKLGYTAPLNLNQDEKLLFPSQYSSNKEEQFKAYRSFPATDAAVWKSPTEREIQDFPILADGYYVVLIASLHYQSLLQCLMIPEPSHKPHPSLIDVLSGNFNILPLRSMGTFLHEPARYTWDEVREISTTASQISDKTFVFAVELHQLKTNVVQAHLQRAYICPPEQIQEALEADRI